MEAWPVDRLVDLGRTSVRQRLVRWRSKGWQIGQAAVAAGVAWFVADTVLGHPTPFFAPIAAVVGLGVSYGQRLRRVTEVTVGVAVGVLVGDVVVAWIGSGAWQLTLIVALAMSAAFVVDAGQVLVSQAAVQSILIATILPTRAAAVDRVVDALVGGAVALAAATVVPAAPLRRPRDQASRVVDKIAALLRASATVMVEGRTDPAMELLADARATDHLIRELQAAADEGLSVVASSPFRVRHKPGVRRMADLVEPLDRALRSTRVLVRRTAMAAYRQAAVPPSYARLAEDLAVAADLVAEELAADRQAEAARPALLQVAHDTRELERTGDLPIEGILLQLRSVVVDLLLVTGLDQYESTDALPPTG